MPALGALMNESEAPKEQTAPATETHEFPVEVDMLEESLRLTPWERLLENERALALVRMLEAARACDHHGTPKPNP